MHEFGFEPYSEGLRHDPFSENCGESFGPFIPEVKDCLACGVCITRCPTYKVTAEENYGPRGRVRLIEKVLRDNAVLEEGEFAALTACTLCRACEAVCPSKMQYGDLYRRTLEVLGFRPAKGVILQVLLGRIVEGRTAQRFMNTLIQLYQRSGIQRLVHSLPFSLLRGDLGRLEQLLPVPHVSARVPDYSRTSAGTPKGDLMLFTGCIANILDTQTHNATIQLLTRLGYNVLVPENQTCCGAIYAHNGEIERARACARRNIDTFSSSGVDTVIFNASGCGAFLTEYPALLNDTPLVEPITELPATDIIEFMAEPGRLGELAFRKLRARVAVHEPCSQRNVLKNHQSIYALLENIPGLDIVPLPGNDICCGAGGTKMVTHPELASPLRDEKIKALAETKADLLISTNLTCALNLSKGIREAGHEIEVMHPVRLLAQQLF